MFKLPQLLLKYKKPSAVWLTGPGPGSWPSASLSQSFINQSFGPVQSNIEQPIKPSDTSSAFKVKQLKRSDKRQHGYELIWIY